MRRFILVSALAFSGAVGGFFFCVPAYASARLVLGMNVDGPAVDGSVDLARQLRDIRASGATSVRYTMYWSLAQPYPSWAAVPAERRGDFTDLDGVPTDLRATDRFVSLAALHHLDVLPVVITAPAWASSDGTKLFAPPRDPGQFGTFVGQLVRRYGSAGTFRAAGVAQRPVRAWQIWNEPAGFRGFGDPSAFWQGRPSPKRYLALLRAARQAIRIADPRAKVVVGGLFGRSWTTMSTLYRSGARGLFDAVAMNVYTETPQGVVEVTRRTRAVLRANGDARIPLMITEVAWTTAKGHVDDPLSIATTPAGQASRLRRSLLLLASQAQTLRLTSVYWYTWITRDASSTLTFDYAGLRTLDGATTVDKPARRVLAQTAKDLARRR